MKKCFLFTFVDLGFSAILYSIQEMKSIKFWEGWKLLELNELSELNECVPQDSCSIMWGLDPEVIW
jgi:hypothetical protein